MHNHTPHAFIPDFVLMTDNTENVPETVTCDHCGGSGEGPADGTNCWVCKGAGIVATHIDADPYDDGDAAYDQWNEEERK